MVRGSFPPTYGLRRVGTGAETQTQMQQSLESQQPLLAHILGQVEEAPPFRARQELAFPPDSPLLGLLLPLATMTLATCGNEVLCSPSSRRGDILPLCSHLESVIRPQAQDKKANFSHSYFPASTSSYLVAGTKGV